MCVIIDIGLYGAAEHLYERLISFPYDDDGDGDGDVKFRKVV